MANKKDYLRWNLFLKKQYLIFKYGLKNGLIHSYEADFIENLRKVYYGGIPASIMLLCVSMCNGLCYDRGLLATFGFGDDDFNLVDADIDVINLNPLYINRTDPHYGNHCFVERIKKDGSVWVYDTTYGLVFEKNLYYRLQKPQVTARWTREETINFVEYQDIKNASIERDKYAIPLILPTYEYFATSFDEIYGDALREEIEIFKKDIGYEEICEELNQDMERHGFGRYKIISR